MARPKKNKATTAAADLAEAEAAEARRIEIDEARAANHAHALELATSTMTGDLRDLLLDTLRHEQDKRPWDQRGEGEQRETIHRIEAAMQEAVRKAVELISASGLPTIRATLDSVMVKDGLKLSLTMPKTSDQRYNIMDAQGGVVMLVVADADQFMGARGEVKVKPDQADIEHVLAEHSGDDADHAAEIDDAHAPWVDANGPTDPPPEDTRPGWRGDRDFTSNGASPLKLTMPGVFLRDYQEQAKQDVRTAMRTHRRVCLVMPTGSGKTVTFSSIAAMVWTKGLRAYLGAHRIEIVLQIAKALRAEGVRFGIIAPGYPETSAPVQVFMVQTMVHRLGRYPRPDFLVLDECHHAVAAGYQKLLDHWDGIHVLGVTATPARLDGKGLAGAFDALVLGPSMSELMARGYLCRYSYFAPPVVANLGALRTRAGDFTAAEAAAAMDQRSVTGDAEAHYRKMLDGKPAIAFCSSVAHAEHVAEAFRARGWKAASVDGSMDAVKRADFIASIGDGRLNVLASCDIISEGTDIPVVQGAIMLRPTLSTVIYMQQAGRVLRPKRDGSRAVILDHVGNVLRHGLPEAPRNWSLIASPKRAQAAAVRTCPACYLTFSPAPRCPGCGHVFQAPATPRAPAKQVAGDLQEVQAGSYLATAPLDTLVKAARTKADLQKIADARGYKPGWVAIKWHHKSQGQNYRSGWDRHA